MHSFHVFDVVSLNHFILALNTGLSGRSAVKSGSSVHLSILYVQILSETFIVFGFSTSLNDLTAAKLFFSQLPEVVTVFSFFCGSSAKCQPGDFH